MMDVTRRLPHMLADAGEERDHIVFYRFFYFIDPGDVKFRLLLDFCQSFGRDLFSFGQGFAGKDLHIQPDLELVFRFPKSRHFR